MKAWRRNWAVDDTALTSKTLKFRAALPSVPAGTPDKAQPRSTGVPQAPVWVEGDGAAGFIMK